MDALLVGDVTGDLPAERSLSVADLVDELAASHAYCAPRFKRSEQQAWAEVNLRSLLTAEVLRKNVEAMALRWSGGGSGGAGDAASHWRSRLG